MSFKDKILVWPWQEESEISPGEQIYETISIYCWNFLGAQLLLGPTTPRRTWDIYIGIIGRLEGSGENTKTGELSKHLLGKVSYGKIFVFQRNFFSYLSVIY